jgi:hypothetical protein
MKDKKQFPQPAKADVGARWHSVVRRRSFLTGMGTAGAATLASGKLFGQPAKLPSGDVAILKFLAAAEIIESDLWTQYAELGGANGGNPAYIAALQNLDGDMPQYITDNTDDELSHAAFINAYLMSKGEDPVSLDAFRRLPSSSATGAQKINRITNLQNLSVDTSYYTRYRSDENPDFGDTFPQAVTIVGQPAIPKNDTETPPNTPQPVPPVSAAAKRMQAIANTAAFHFAMIEQGGASLYTTMSLKVTDVEVLRIVVSIGGVETDHFALWHDKLGNAVSMPLAGVVDPITGLTFPNLNDSSKFTQENFQTNKILPEPCDFLRNDSIKGGLPHCSVIRPSTTKESGAVAAVEGLTADHLFEGQGEDFLDFISQLAVDADAAERQIGRSH